MDNWFYKGFCIIPKLTGLSVLYFICILFLYSYSKCWFGGKSGIITNSINNVFCYAGMIFSYIWHAIDKIAFIFFSWHKIWQRGRICTPNGKFLYISTWAFFGASWCSRSWYTQQRPGANYQKQEGGEIMSKSSS